jgi:hypothetical protein
VRRIAVAVAAGLVSACGSNPDIVTRPVTVHVPQGCAVGGDPHAFYIATGDFQPQGPRLGIEVTLDAFGTPLTIPAGTRELSATLVSDGVDHDWWALVELPESGDIDLFALPPTLPCELTQPGDGPLAARTDAAIGALDAQRVLVAGGVRATDRGPAESFAIDLTNGNVSRLASDLIIPRSSATVTAFGSRSALVAGGANPVTGENLQTAEVFVEDKFDGAPIILFEGRSLHGAVALGTGETLLVGGQGARGPLASLEIVDPVTRKFRIGVDPQHPFPPLEFPRVRPTVLRLATGEILVAGGVDAQGTPVPWLEWFSPDLTTHIRSRQLVASVDEAFVALPGGGALAVIATPAPNVANVWLVSRAGDISSGQSIAAPLTEVRLFQGSAGAPVLWTGDRWLRWEPWRGEFGRMAEVEGAGPNTADFLAPDPGLSLWLRADQGRAAILGLRFDTRGPYTTDTVRGALLVDNTVFFAPDRLVTPKDVPLAFDVERGLLLAPGASAFLTDATFASFTLDVDITGSAPLVVLRRATGPAYGAEIEIGGATCPIALPGGTTALHLRREGAAITVALDQDDPKPCVTAPKDALAPDVRVSVGLRGTGDGPTSAKNFMIKRF